MYVLLSYLIMYYIIFYCGMNYKRFLFVKSFFGVPAWRLKQVYSMTVGFSPTLYC